MDTNSDNGSNYKNINYDIKDINDLNEEKKKVHYAWLKVLGIVGLVVVTAAAVGTGVGLALGGFGISMGIPLVGSALVTAGGWLATAIPGLGAFGVALPIAIGAIAGFGIAFLAISGIRKLIKSFGNEQSKGNPPELNEKYLSFTNDNNGENENKKEDKNLFGNDENKSKTEEKNKANETEKNGGIGGNTEEVIIEAKPEEKKEEKPKEEGDPKEEKKIE